MSGGSWNYLCYEKVEATGLADHAGTLTEMAHALRGYEGGKEIADATEALAIEIRLWAEEADDLNKRVAELALAWKAVEMHHSNDWSEDDVRDAIAAYRIAQKSATADLQYDQEAARDLLYSDD